MSCPDRDDLAGLALGALEPREERRITKHAESCERCQAELRRLAPAVGVLAESVEQLEPPHTLRQSLMAAVHGDAAGSTAPPGRRGRVLGFLWRPAAAIGVTALFAAGAIGYALRDEEEDARRIPVDGTAAAGGSIVVEGDDAILHAHGMRTLAKGAVYQVWVAEDGRVTPSATFVPHRDGTATAAVPEVAEGATQVMVTAEPRPGLRRPSGEPVLDARID